MSGPANRQTVEAPRHPGPTVSLLSSAGIVPPDPNDPMQRWLNGIRYQPDKCATGLALPVGCASGSAAVAATKTIDGNEATVFTDPFLVFAGDKCSTLGWEERNYAERAARYLGTFEAALVEKEFWGGAAAQAGIAAGVSYPTDQWLTSGGAAVLGSGAAMPPQKAWSTIFDALSAAPNGQACTGGSPAMIHVPRSVLPYLQAANLVRREGNLWLDGLDNIVVPGTGYLGTDPDGDAPASGTAWVYVTSMVRIYRDETLILPGTYAEALDRAHNDIAFRAERTYLVDWDRCCHFAALVEGPWETS